MLALKELMYFYPKRFCIARDLEAVFVFLIRVATFKCYHRTCQITFWIEFCKLLNTFWQKCLIAS